MVEGRGSAATGEVEVTAVLGSGQTAPGSLELPAPGPIGDGRYVVLETLGAGGMGVVVRAYDSRLRREVALKRLRSAARDPSATARMVREAQAMAQLSHPNVVPVYDVEVGDDDVVIAMEYVAGQTVADWLLEADRSWSEVVRVFTAAARGLAAAHRAGQIHRDFKAANVLIASDGAVKVTDFGLVKPTEEASISIDPSGSELPSGGGDSLTRADTVMGTPRYMAPEQHAGQGVTPAADQYALCVALWEALAGAPPFSKDTLGELARVKRGGPPPWPRERAVPHRIVEAIERGLAPDPEKRWPSMDALIGALQPPAASRRLRIVAATGGLLVLAAGAALLGHRDETCAGARAQLDGVWDDTAHQAADASMRGTGLPMAPAVVDRALPALDDYAEQWVAGHDDACTATAVRGEQSDAILDLRMSCLHRARAALQATGAVLADADTDVLARADTLVADLPPLARCSDIDALTSEVPPPDSAADREQAEHLRAELERVRAVKTAGRYHEALQQVTRLRAEAEALGYAPLRAEIDVEHGFIQGLVGHEADAERSFRHALHTALSVGAYRTATSAASQLGSTAAVDGGRPGEGLAFADVALGLAERPDATLRDRAAVLNNRGMTLRAAGRFDEAAEDLLSARELFVRALGEEDPEATSALLNLANVRSDQGRHDEARALREEVLRILAASYGPHHPKLANIHVNLSDSARTLGDLPEAEREVREALAIIVESLGDDDASTSIARMQLANVLYSEGRYPQASAEYRRARKGFAERYGPESPNVATAMANLANCARALGDFDEARELGQEALRIRRKVLPPGHPDIAWTLASTANDAMNDGDPAEAVRRLNEALEVLRATYPDDGPLGPLLGSLGNAHLQAGDPVAAEAAYRQTLTAFSSTLGPTSATAGKVWSSIGRALAAQGRLAEAIEAQQRGLRIREAALGPDHVEIADSLSALGDALLRDHRPAEALPHLQRALKIRRAAEIAPVYVAQSELALARAQWAAGGDRKQALDLARHARDVLKDSPDAYADDLQTARDWLAAHGG